MILISSLIGGAIAGFIGRYAYGSYQWRKRRNQAYQVLMNMEEK